MDGLHEQLLLLLQDLLHERLLLPLLLQDLFVLLLLVLAHQHLLVLQVLHLHFEVSSLQVVTLSDFFVDLLHFVEQVALLLVHAFLLALFFLRQLLLAHDVADLGVVEVHAHVLFLFLVLLLDALLLEVLLGVAQLFEVQVACLVHGLLLLNVDLDLGLHLVLEFVGCLCLLQFTGLALVENALEIDCVLERLLLKLALLLEILVL